MYNMNTVKLNVTNLKLGMFKQQNWFVLYTKLLCQILYYTSIHK
jgi:hypothetical protein